MRHWLYILLVSLGAGLPTVCPMSYRNSKELPVRRLSTAVLTGTCKCCETIKTEVSRTSTWLESWRANQGHLQHSLWG
jgi:hypothetical protein